MKKINKIYISALMGLGFVSCSSEAPFTSDQNAGSGKVLTTSLALHVKADTPKTRVNGDGIPTQGDFKVNFFKKGDDQNAVKSYESYADMPEVVELPEGDYYISVTYGGDYGNGATAAFNAPYYAGKSDDFTVEVNKIVDNIKPIVCRLQNVRVSVNFDVSLSSAMSPDSKVTVKVGESSATTLDFTKDTTKDGYFEYAEGSNTLIATFIGEVEGEKVEESRTFDNVEAGNYYQITFKLNYANSAGPGNIEPGPGNSGIDISASVTYKDLSDNDNFNDVTPDDEEIYIEDDMRPENGEDPNQGDKDNPGKDEPDDPDNPTPGEDDNTPGPQITSCDEVDLNSVNDALSLSSCVLYIHCDAGIKTFTVDIDSPELVADLEGMTEWEDASHLDMVNPGEKKEFLEQLLDREIGECVIGLSEMEFDISNFLSLMESFTGIHKFIVNVTDLNGKSSKATLQLEIK